MADFKSARRNAPLNTVSAIVGDAFSSCGIAELSNNEVGRLLGMSGWVVGKWRRRLEQCGSIPHITYRLGRRGYVDVRAKCRELAMSVQVGARRRAGL